jgi:hypothetical protein
LSYEQTDIFLVCFNVACPASFANVKEKWFPEVKHHCLGVPCLLVGLQIDLRDSPIVTEKLGSQKQGVVTSEQGERLAREVGAHRYVECSALTRKGLKEVFDWESAQSSHFSAARLTARPRHYMRPLRRRLPALGLGRGVLSSKPELLDESCFTKYLHDLLLISSTIVCPSPFSHTPRALLGFKACRN